MKLLSTMYVLGRQTRQVRTDGDEQVSVSVGLSVEVKGEGRDQGE